MRPWASAIAWIGVAATMGGCVDSTTTVLVRHSGSGTVTEEVYVTKPMERMMNTLMTMASALGTSTNATSRSETGADALRAVGERRLRLMGEGVSLLSIGSVKRADGANGVKCVYSFADVGKLKVCVEPFHPLLPAEASTLNALPAPPAARSMLTFSFASGPNAKLTVHVPWAQEAASWGMRGPVTATLSTEESALLRHVLDGFRARLFIAAEGGVTRASGGAMEDDPADRGRRRVALFDLNLGETVRDETAVARLAGIGPVEDLAQALARYQGLQGVRVETRESVTIEF